MNPTRRLAAVASHIAPSRSESSYESIHGPVPRHPVKWIPVEKFDLEEVVYEKAEEGISKITIDRPEKRNAFTPRTVEELSACFADSRDDSSIGVVILTGKGTEAFCSGGDVNVRSEKGGYVGKDGIPRLNVLDLQARHLEINKLR